MFIRPIEKAFSETGESNESLVHGRSRVGYESASITGEQELGSFVYIMSS